MSEKVEVKPWTPPLVCVGHVVQWVAGPGHPPVAALVVGKGDGAVVHLRVWGVNSEGTRDAVRHQDDPWVRDEGYQARQGVVGTWRFIDDGSGYMYPYGPEGGLK